MLDVATVLRPSSEDKFDTVVFFDKDADAVNETQKRIPGAIGFPGNFTEVVLTGDPNEDLYKDPDPLAPPNDETDRYLTRKKQLILAQRRRFIKTFPFDVINLDLEEFIFKPNDPFPGKVVNALRKIFEWQRLPLFYLDKELPPLDGFTLMFTTQIGPPNISNEYVDMLRRYLVQNLDADPVLRDLLETRTGLTEIDALRSDQFPIFFKLGVPKLLAGILLDEDWYVDPDTGIRTYEFVRQSSSGDYTMLHFVMDVVRQDPPREKRAPNTGLAPNIATAYRDVSRGIFEIPETVVTESIIDADNLKPTLQQIKARRKKYYPDE
jgi:hypothetical protein